MAPDDPPRSADKVVPFPPKGERKRPGPVQPKPASTFATAADEWVQSDVSMPDLARRWGVSRATIFRWRKKQNWGERKRAFEARVKQRREEILRERQQTADLPASLKDDTARARSVDESAADAKATAELLLQRVVYAATGHLAEAFHKEKVAGLDGPESLAELFRMAKTHAEFYKLVVGEPEPPPKPAQVFEVRIAPQGGAIQTVERRPGESLDAAMRQLVEEFERAKELLVESFIAPAGPAEKEGETSPPEALN